jgi:hypothetical protein
MTTGEATGKVTFEPDLIELLAQKYPRFSHAEMFRGTAVDSVDTFGLLFHAAVDA